MSTQFAHLQTFSRKPNKAGQSVAQVIGELLRELLYAAHVPEPAPPEVVDGISPQELRAQHDAMIAAAQTRVVRNGKVSYSAIRKDRHTLLTAIASYPLSYEEINGNPKEQAALRAWEKANVAFFKKFFGAHYRAIYRHTDETYPHLHIYALPVGVKGIDAQMLHPGKAAKKTTEARLKSEGTPPYEAVAAGNLALKGAMRDWQDLYYREVGEPCGLLRDGPKRQRLSRAQYMARAAEARLRSTSSLIRQKEQLDEAERVLQAQMAALKVAQDDLAEQMQAMDAREAAQKIHEEQLDTAVQILRQAGDRMQRIVEVTAMLLGLENTSKLEDALTEIEEALHTIEENARDEPSVMQDAYHPDLPELTPEAGGMAWM